MLTASSNDCKIDEHATLDAAAGLMWLKNCSAPQQSDDANDFDFRTAVETFPDAIFRATISKRLNCKE